MANRNTPDRARDARPQLCYQVKTDQLQTSICTSQLTQLIYRSKPSWWTKYQDPVIKQKWIEEAKAQRIRGFQLEDEHIQYVLDELSWFAQARTESGIQVR